MTWTREQVMSVVERSPECVAAKDKTGWLALFASSATVEDPVGAAPHHKGARAGGPGGDELERFYETFIACNEIRFDVHGEWVVGLEVVRDVTIRTRLPNGFALEVPAHLLYELEEDDGALRIRRLAAHWELARLSLLAVTRGWKGLGAVTAQSLRMLRIEGPLGVAGYLRGLTSGIRSRGKRAAKCLVEAINARDVSGLAAMGSGGEVAIELAEEPATSRQLAPGELLRLWGPEVWMEAGERVSAGWTTSFRFSLQGGRDRGCRGVAFLVFDPRDQRLRGVRFFGERLTA